MTDHVDAIARAVLYEGYNLYPYRPTSVKNQKRFTFGVLVPRAYSDAQRGTEAWRSQTQCLVVAPPGATLDARARFLHLVDRMSDAGSWQEAVEREVLVDTIPLDTLAAAPRRVAFAFDGGRETDGDVTRESLRVEGEVAISAERLGDDLLKLTIVLANTADFDPDGATREDALRRSLASAHSAFRAHGADFVSLLDPPDAYRAAAASCENVGTWPVLVGEEDARDVMLSSPIILYDHPKIAPESAGDLFDGLEIDEILTLRILTLTEDEKREMRGVDEPTRRLLERTETMPDDHLAKLHGALRGLRPAGKD